MSTGGDPERDEENEEKTDWSPVRSKEAGTASSHPVGQASPTPQEVVATHPF